MKKKLVVLLVLVLALCFTASAMAAVVVYERVDDVPATKLTASDVPTIEEYGWSDDSTFYLTLSEDIFSLGDKSANIDLEFYSETGYKSFYLSDSDLGEGVTQKGNTYYFSFPNDTYGLEWGQLGVHEDNASAYRSIWGYTYTQQHEEDGTYLEVSYTSDGKIASVYNYDGEQSWTVNFNTETGEAISYGTYIDYDDDCEWSNYSISYDLDGNVLSANYWGNDADGEYFDIYWDPDIGWYEFAWNDEIMDTERVPVSADGVKLPTSFKAPYMRKKAQDSTWYANNTVGVAGLPLRDLYPDLTSKWYNIVPVDLTQDGTQTIQLVASNLYYFGKAYVTVADGNVTVSYSMPKGLSYLNSECLQWFTSADEITHDFLEAPAGEYAFGEPVSIADQLNGQDTALLFICNNVTYRQPINYDGGNLVRYYDGNSEWREWRADLTKLLEGMN